MFFFFFSKPYITIVGEITDKAEAGKMEHIKKLDHVLQNVNRRYGENMSAKFMETINNEFQGVLCQGKDILSILLDIKNQMYPLKVRFGVGIGEIKEESLSDLSITAKGPGCEKAREALEYLRTLDNRKQTGITDVRIKAAGDGNENEKLSLVNTILSLLTMIEYSWSDRQREIIYNIMQYKEKQAGVAKRLGITQSTVQKSLSAGKYYTYAEAVQTLNRVFAEIGDKNYEK